MYKDYPLNNNYIVYDDGRIYSKTCKKFLTPKKNWDGYHRIQIWENNTVHCVAWHRVVAETFCTKKDSTCKVVNHINGIKSDNRAINLEWVTQKENIAHAWKNGLSTRKNHSTYTNLVVDDTITGKVYEFETLKDLAETLAFSYFSVYNAYKNNRLYLRRYKIYNKV